MYEGNNMAMAQTEAKSIVGGQRLDVNPTVEENIDNRIAYLKGEIDRLEKSKATLAPLLPMRIRDIREAMNY